MRKTDLLLVLRICMLCLVFSFPVSFLTGCSESEEILQSVNSNDAKQVVDLVGSMRYDKEYGRWIFIPDARYSNPFASETKEMPVVEICNWKSDYEAFKEGCLIQGYYKEVNTVLSTGKSRNISHISLTITDAAKYHIQPSDDCKDTDENQMLPCVVLDEICGTRAYDVSKYIPLKEYFNNYNSSVRI